MSRVMLSLLVATVSFSILAQPPLSKRDKKKLAEWEMELEAEKNYKATIQKAEAAFESDRYVDARMLYSEAISYNEEKRAWLTAKVNDLDILLARNAARQIDTIQSVASKGVQRIQMGKTPDGKVVVRQMSMELKPVDRGEEEVVVEEPVAVVKEVEPEIAVVEEKPKAAVKVEKEAPKAAKIEPAEPIPDLYEDFGRGITEDHFTFSDHEVTRIVVKDGIDTIAYKMVKHRWGGEFYFKDDVSISKRIWLEQVEQYRRRFGSDTNE